MAAEGTVMPTDILSIEEIEEGERLLAAEEVHFEDGVYMRATEFFFDSWLRANATAILSTLRIAHDLQVKVDLLETGLFGGPIASVIGQLPSEDEMKLIEGGPWKPCDIHSNLDGCSSDMMHSYCEECGGCYDCPRIAAQSEVK